MHVVTEILGNLSDPAMHRRVHHLEHHGSVETITVPRADLARRRLKAATDEGTPIAIALPRTQRLEDGAVVVMTDTRAVILRVEAEDWLRLRPADDAAALRLGDFAGNLHWRVSFDGGDLLVAIEHEEQRYRDRLVELIAEGTVAIVEPDTEEVTG